MRAKKATRKNPVAVKEPLTNDTEHLEFGVAKVKVLSLEEAAKQQGLPTDVYEELLQEDIEDGRFLFVDKETHEYFQDENFIEGCSEAFEIYGEDFVLINLFFPDGIDRCGFNISEWRFL